MTAPQAGAGATGKRRGRKPRASQGEIVQASIDLLEREPLEPLTIARVAEAAGLAPMTLYRYFDDRDALMVAIMRAVRAAREPIAIAEDGSWQDEVRSWMFSVRNQVGRYPQLLQFTAAGGHQAWLVDGAELVGILEPLGSWDDDDLSRATYWVAGNTLAHAMLEATRPPESQTGAMYAELAHLPQDAADRMARVIPGLVRLHDQSFGLVVDRTLVALETMVPESGNS